MTTRTGVRAARRNGALALGLLLAISLVCGGLVWAAPAGANHDPYCYAVGGTSSHVLVRIDKDDFDPDTNEVVIGTTDTLKSDALTVQPGTGVLYSVNTLIAQETGYLGTLDLATGQFVTRSTSFGTGNGELGPVTFHDISGLSFEPNTGALYASHVRFEPGGVHIPDVLFQVNPSTGQYVPNAFGGDDYVVIDLLPAPYAHLSDIDDIAFDPGTGALYGIANRSSNDDRLVIIDQATGSVTDVGPFDVGEVEGLSFDPHGNLWATASSASGTEANRLYAVNKNTGAASNPRLLDDSYNYEGLGCLTAGSAPGTSTPTPTRTAMPTATATSGPPPDLDEAVYLPFIGH